MDLKSYIKYYLVCVSCCLVTQSCSKNRLLFRDRQEEQELSMIRAKEAHDLIEKIAYFFSNDTVKGSTMEERFFYPEYCGGLYINKDKKVVLICVEDTSLCRKVIAKKIGRNDFLMQAGTYSYNTLESILKELRSFYLDQGNRNILEEVGLGHFGLDVQRNGIYIELKECSAEKIYLFKRKVMDSPAFIFEKSLDSVVIDSY